MVARATLWASFNGFGKCCDAHAGSSLEKCRDPMGEYAGCQALSSAFAVYGNLAIAGSEATTVRALFTERIQRI